MRFDAHTGLRICAVVGSLIPLTWQRVSCDSPPSPTTNNQQINPSTDKLKLVQVVFRHGARTPLSGWNELWGNTAWDVCGTAFEKVPLEITDGAGNPQPPSPGNERQVAARLEGGCHKGELTLVGQAQAYFLGQWLRKRYVEDFGFLPSSYMADTVVGRTTNYQRTVGTIQGVLTGLYPDAPGPIHIVTATDLDEVLFADSRHCPHIMDLLRQAKATLAETLKHEPERPRLMEEARRIFPTGPEEFWGRRPFVDIHDVITALAVHGKPLPEGATPEFVKAVDRQATKEFRAIIAPSLQDEKGHDMVRLSMGRLLDILMGNMEEAAAQPPASPAASGKMFLYSGHDSTILPLVVALGHEPEDWPPFLSNVVLELWERTDGQGGSRHLVRVLYNQQQMDLPGCAPGTCPDLASFREDVVGPFILSQQDHREACAMKVSHNKSMPRPKLEGGAHGSAPMLEGNRDASAPRSEESARGSAPTFGGSPDASAPKLDATPDASAPMLDSDLGVSTPKREGTPDASSPMLDSDRGVSAPKRAGEPDASAPRPKL